MNIFSCVRAIPCFLYLNELIFNILRLAQKRTNSYDLYKSAQKCLLYAQRNSVQNLYDFCADWNWLYFKGLQGCTGRILHFCTK